VIPITEIKVSTRKPEIRIHSGKHTHARTLTRPHARTCVHAQQHIARAQHIARTHTASTKTRTRTHERTLARMRPQHVENTIMQNTKFEKG
jgi:hypothetical protein